MPTSIYIELIKAIASTSISNLGAYISVLLFLLVLAVPLGYLLMRATRIFEKESLRPIDIFFISLGFGICILTLASLFLVFLSLNLILLVPIIFVLDISLYYLARDKIGFKIPEIKNRTEDAAIYGIFIFLFLYYSIKPLTVEYIWVMDYDLFSLGIRETWGFSLPFTEINSYYPPAVSTVTAFLSLAFPEIQINKLLIITFFFLAFVVYTLVFELGVLGLGSRKGGLFLLLAFCVMAAPKNATGIGTGYPSILSTIFLISCFITLLQYFKEKNPNSLLLSGIFFGGVPMSHMDIFFSFVWGWLALFLAFLIWGNLSRTQVFKIFSLVTAIGLLVASPYLYSGLTNVSKFKDEWKETGQWDEKIHDESSPKDFGRETFVHGKIIFLLIALGIVYTLRYKAFLGYFAIIWLIFIIFQNTWTFLYFSGNFIHIYPLNVIMWTGLIFPFVVLGGMGIKILYEYFDTKKVGAHFLIFMTAISFFTFVDYETFNYQKVLRSQDTGYLMNGLSAREVHFTDSDIEAAKWLKRQDFSGIVLNFENYPGSGVPVVSEKPTSYFFVGSGYVDPVGLKNIAPLMKDSEFILNHPNDDKSMELIKKHNVEYIFISSNNPLDYTPLIESPNFHIVHRADGVKILAPIFNETRENRISVNSLRPGDYHTNDSIGYSSLLKGSLNPMRLGKGQSIEIQVNKSDFDAELVNIHIKHMTFVYPLSFDLKIGDYKKEISITSNKLKYSETAVTIPRELLGDPIILTGKADKRIFFGFEIIPEICWIEIEESRF